MAHIRISEAEWAVMVLLWERSPQTAPEICRQLVQERGGSEKTLRTYINRLVEKGAIICETGGKEYRFRPQVKREDCVREESRNFVCRVFQGMTMPLLAHFIQSTELSKADLDELKRLVEVKERETKARQTHG
jgi:BlaI family penicillinase repressor